MKKQLLFLLLFISKTLLGQLPDAKRDYQWLVGYKDSVEKTVINLLDFNTLPQVIQPFKVYDGSIPLGSIALVCDTLGRILLYTNGCNVLNSPAVAGSRTRQSRIRDPAGPRGADARRHSHRR